MSNNPKQRLTLTDLREPQQLRELNRQLSWIWDRLLGGLSMKSLDAGARQVIEDKAGRSELTQTASEIRAEVTGIQVGGANYLLNSGTPVEKTAYLLASYPIGDIKPVEDETYTLRLWGELGDDRTGFVAHNTNAYVWLGELINNGDGTHSVTFKWNNKRSDYPEYNVDIPETVRIYQRPSSGTSASKIYRIKLEAGNKATDWTQHPEEFRAGTSVVINKDQFSVTTPEFNVNITSEDGTKRMLNIGEDGIHTPAIDCPNVAQKYDGPGNITIDVNATSAQIAAGTHYRSLKTLAAFLSEKRVSKQLNVSIAAGHVEYGYVKFRGIVGSYWIQLIGDSSSPAKVVGVIECSFNSTPVLLRCVNVDLDKNHSNYGVHAEGSSTTMTVRNCVITGPGVSVTNTFAVAASRNAFAYVYDCELYDCMRSLYGSLSGVISSNNCKGNCNVSASQSTLHLVGTMPCESTTWATVTKAGQVLTNNVTVDQGSKPTPEPEATSVSYTATAADTWAGSGWNIYNNNDDIYQGYTDALGEHRGCVWFDGSAIKKDVGSKSIKQATLTLYQVSGVGRNQPVQVSLEGITVEYGGSQPFGKTEHEYGAIGTTLGINRATTFTLPANAINHLVSGTIKGFMVRTGETASAKGDDNSANYARFTGSGTNAPVLTVTYA